MSCTMSGCSTGAFDEYDDYQATITTANQDFLCCECGRTIPAGARFEHATGSYEERTYTHRTCLDCVQIATAFLSERQHESLWEILEGEYGEPAPFEDFGPACLDKLKTASAKALLVEHWRHWKGLAK